MTISRKRRALMLLSAGLGLAACASAPATSRDTPPPPALNVAPGPADAPRARGFRVTDVRVRVPRRLKVSEKNRFYTAADIVWREDPIGDRHAQVADVIREAMTEAAGRLDGDVPVVLDVEVTRFHALTEKARYTIGGVHAIQFHLTLLDPKTGQPLAAPRWIKADFDALGGAAAIASEARGITQRVRITQHLAKVVEDELTDPAGYLVRRNGIVGAINQI